MLSLQCEMKKKRISKAEFILGSHLDKEHVHTHVDTHIKRLEGKVRHTSFWETGSGMVSILPIFSKCSTLGVFISVTTTKRIQNKQTSAKVPTHPCSVGLDFQKIPGQAAPTVQGGGVFLSGAAQASPGLTAAATARLCCSLGAAAVAQDTPGSPAGTREAGPGSRPQPHTWLSRACA